MITLEITCLFMGHSASTPYQTNHSRTNHRQVHPPHLNRHPATSHHNPGFHPGNSYPRQISNLSPPINHPYPGPHSQHNHSNQSHLSHNSHTTHPSLNTHNSYDPRLQQHSHPTNFHPGYAGGTGGPGNGSNNNSNFRPKTGHPKDGNRGHRKQRHHNGYQSDMDVRYSNRNDPRYNYDPGFIGRV